MPQITNNPSFFKTVGITSTRHPKLDLPLELTLGLQVSTNAPMVVDTRRNIGVVFTWEELVQKGVDMGAFDTVSDEE